MKRGEAAQSNLPLSTTTPPMAVPWPPIHLVAEWTTMSAPHSIGRAEDRREGVVDDDRHAVLVGDGGDAFEVRHVQARVADRLEVDGLGLAVDRLLELVQLGAVDEAEVDAVLGQRVLEEVVRAAVQRGAGDDVVAGAGQIEDRERLGRLAGRHAERPDATLEGGDALLEDVGGRVHDPGVDVAELLQPEEPGGVVGVVEDVARRGVDRDGAGLGRGVDALAGVDGEGFAAEGGCVLVGHGVLLGTAPHMAAGGSICG